MNGPGWRSQSSEHGRGEHFRLRQTVIGCGADFRKIDRQQESGVALAHVKKSLIPEGFVTDAGNRVKSQRVVYEVSVATVFSSAVF